MLQRRPVHIFADQKRVQRSKRLYLLHADLSPIALLTPGRRPDSING